MKRKYRRSTTTWKILTSVPRHKKVVSADQECNEMCGSTDVAKLGPQE